MAASLLHDSSPKPLPLLMSGQLVALVTLARTY